MELCARCKKRIAVVYITRMDGDKTINEGICIKCAKELGIKPVNDIIQNMGISDEDLDRMDLDMSDMLSPAENTDGENDNPEILGKTPPVDMNKLFNGLFPNMRGQQAPNGSPQNPRTRRQEGKEKKFLGMYCTDLTKQAREGKLDRIIGRDRELSRLMQILCRRQKNNPCLIGEPGVGKTAIAESLAIAIAKKFISLI